ncbi:alkaline phosphatase D family protein [uncultured Pseudacidovorax sp.]|uniref:alkaline phosphatase D family protein n=1 Tax=uncultured Pseudacidovorax sp. TaxID=679313 RepID=UPI0025E413E0|nr:alkaline phosphatase D family protein [uncultured Pseudacidovorax sp.]
MPQPLKIAFTSCAEATQFPSQPVWTRIAEAQPDHLVLLGDSVYYDVHGSDMGAIQRMSAEQFGRHAHGRLQRQLDCPEFRALVAGVRTHAIWDDHDFLWNNARGADLAAGPQWREHLAYSRCLFRAFRDALAASPGPGRMPAFDSIDHTRPPPAPGYQRLRLAEDVVLHLTDGRSFKAGNGSKALLGQPQMSELVAGCDDPQAVHLVASGVVFERDTWLANGADRGETWADCPQEHDQLLALAAQRRLLLLSGDIHRNAFRRYQRYAGETCLFEATASGAALPAWMMASRNPTTLHHWGLATVHADRVEVGLYHSGGLAESHTIPRDKWQ